MTTAKAHRWEFKPRFRRHAFGWKSQPPIARLRQAVSEINKIAKQNPLLAAEGAILLLERISPALERVDSSSGAIGIAVNNAIEALVPIIANAPADVKIRAAWLERLFAAHQDDQIPYIESLADHWGDLCATREVASAWADRMIDITRRAMDPAEVRGGYFHGSSACLSALYRAGRFEELYHLLRPATIWPYKLWAVKALVAQGKLGEALRYAETCRGPRAPHPAIDAVCEEILLSAGMVDEAYERYGVRANQGGTYLATFRAVARKYPHKTPSEVLRDLVKATPGEEGKWFAAAKEVGLFDEALALANCTPCDPRTLMRAARDFLEKQPAFAVESGLLALRWIAEGYGYEITGLDVWSAYRSTLEAAERLDNTALVKERIRNLAASKGSSPNFVTSVLGKVLHL